MEITLEISEWISTIKNVTKLKIKLVNDQYKHLKVYYCIISNMPKVYLLENVHKQSKQKVALFDPYKWHITFCTMYTYLQ